MRCTAGCSESRVSGDAPAERLAGAAFARAFDFLGRSDSELSSPAELEEDEELDSSALSSAEDSKSLS